MNEIRELKLQRLAETPDNEKEKTNIDSLISPESEVIMKGESSESTDSERNLKTKQSTINTQQTKQETSTTQKEKKKNLQKIVMNVQDTKYPVVRYVGKKIFGWKLTTDPEADWDLYWTDAAVQIDQLGRMKPYQKINHFPGMFSLAQKNHLGRNLMRLKKVFPAEYNFFPPTWNLPSDMVDFRNQFKKKTSNKTYIIKPAASCQGRGIYLTRTWENVATNESVVAQKYISRPFLIDGLKFDLRIYVLLAGCDPLRIYMYEEGLARLATEPYVAPKVDNINNMCMHLTNYAINKENPNFVFNTNEKDANAGHKRSMTSVFQLLQEQGHDVEKLKNQIKKMIVKTFCAVQPILAHNYKSCQPDEPYNHMCFEILGFDVMLDHKLKPWLIEVNHTPSFSTDTPLDRQVKKNVIKDALKLMNVSIKTRLQYKAKQKLNLQKMVSRGKKERQTPEERQQNIIRAQKERDEYEAANLGGYIKLFPLAEEEQDAVMEPYQNYIDESVKWFHNWTGTNIRRNVKKEVKVIKDETGAIIKEGSDSIGPPPQKSLDMIAKIYGNKKAFESFANKTVKSITPMKPRGTSNSENLEHEMSTENDLARTVYNVDARKSSNDQGPIRTDISGEMERVELSSQKDESISRKILGEKREIQKLSPYEVKALSQTGVNFRKPLHDRSGQNKTLSATIRKTNQSARPNAQQSTISQQQKQGIFNHSYNSKTHTEAVRNQPSKGSQRFEAKSERINDLDNQENLQYEFPEVKTQREEYQSHRSQAHTPRKFAESDDIEFYSPPQSKTVNDPRELGPLKGSVEKPTHTHLVGDQSTLPYNIRGSSNRKFRAATANSRLRQSSENNKTGDGVNQGNTFTKEIIQSKGIKGGTQENFYPLVQKGGFLQPKVLKLQGNGVLKPESNNPQDRTRLPSKLGPTNRTKPEFKELSLSNFQGGGVYKLADRPQVPNVNLDEILKFIQKRTSTFVVANAQQYYYNKP